MIKRNFSLFNVSQRHNFSESKQLSEQKIHFNVRGLEKRDRERDREKERERERKKERKRGERKKKGKRRKVRERKEKQVSRKNKINFSLIT